MTQDDSFDSYDNAAEAPLGDAEAIDGAAPEAADGADEPGAESDGDQPATEGGAATEDGEGAPAKPREVVKGIHPELLCQCPECDPDFVELQWFSVDEKKKVKGTIMLFCQRSSRKYFSPAPDLQDWILKNPVASARGGRAKVSEG